MAPCPTSINSGSGTIPGISILRMQAVASYLVLHTSADIVEWKRILAAWSSVASTKTGALRTDADNAVPGPCAHRKDDFHPLEVSPVDADDKLTQVPTLD